MPLETVYRMGGEEVPASGMKDWHNSRGLPWGTPFKGPEPVTISRMARSVMSNISVHLANEHRVDPDSVPWEQHMLLHLAAHLYGRFRRGQGHYHEDPLALYSVSTQRVEWLGSERYAELPPKG